MSRGAAQVRFPDGTVRFGHYQNTSDVVAACLHDEPDWSEHNHYPPPEEAEPVPVRVAVDYGNGFSWDGMATPHRLVSGGVPYGIQDLAGVWIFPPGENRVDGLPDWWVE